MPRRCALGSGLHFEQLLIGATIRELTAAGYLVPRPATSLPGAEALSAALRDVHLLHGDYKADELSTVMRGKVIVGDVVGTWLRLASDPLRTDLLLRVDKEHAHGIWRTSSSWPACRREQSSMKPATTSAPKSSPRSTPTRSRCSAR